MNNRHIQMVLAAGNYYDGGIDGAIGTKTMKAIAAVEAKHAAAYTFDPNTTFRKRRLTAAVQAVLAELDHDPGAVDGWDGVFTQEALNAFLFKQVNGAPEEIKRTPLPAAPGSTEVPRQADVGTYYGRPGADIESKLVTIQLPFKLRIDWNLRQRTNKIRVHNRASAQLEKALIEVRAHYGEEKMSALGIDRYAGAYNKRRMRGGSKWSMHAYGCAIDFYAQPNGLRTRCPDALFCGDEYQPFLDIMEANEWLPAVRLWGADAMHFQRARL